MLILSRFLRLALTALLLAAPSLALAQAPAAKAASIARATYAGGSFWCMEAPYDKLPGVISTTSGYMGGTVKNPTYEMISTGRTGHTEVVQVEYDPAKVSYEKLVEVFWANIDPTVKNAQFCDHGSQYRSGIFYHDDTQRKLAEASKATLDKTKPFKQPIVTEITKAGEFWRAEEYHQDYYQKNPARYKLYRNSCGRDARLKELWGKAPE